MEVFSFLATPGGEVPGRGNPRTLLPWDMQFLIGIVLLLMLITGAACGYYYWNTWRFLVSTDDAAVQAASVIISPRVSGHIVEVLVKDNQPVHAGQVLARMDDRDYRTAVAAAEANVQTTQDAINCVQSEIVAQRLALTEAHTTVTSDQAALTFAQQQSGRYEQVTRVRGDAPQDMQQRSDETRQKEAALARDTATMDVAGMQVEVLKAALAQVQARLLQRQAALRQANLNLSYTTITSPIAGTIGMLPMQVGQHIQPGTRFTVVVPLDSVYVIANYKETQIRDVQPGQPAVVAVDMFPGTFVDGTVDGIAPATEEEFALLSPNNGISNIFKTVQHIPVKIVIDRSDPLLGQLRPGMSVRSTINTHA